MKMNKKIHRIDRDGFQLKWSWSEDRMGLDVDVYKDGTLLLQWFYAKIPGYTSLASIASFWKDQAVIQARIELEKDVKLND